MSSHTGLLKCLGERGMHMTSPSQILAGSPKPEPNNSLGNHLPSPRPQYMDPKYPIRILLHQHLNHSIRIHNNLSPRISNEWKHALTILDFYCYEERYFSVVVVIRSDPRRRLRDGCRLLWAWRGSAGRRVGAAAGPLRTGLIIGLFAPA